MGGSLVDNWQAWVTALFGFILSLLGAQHQREKKKLEDILKIVSMLSERLAVVESNKISDKEARVLLTEYLGPIHEIQKDITAIKVQLARRE